MRAFDSGSRRYHDVNLICVNILSRETCFLCLRGLSPLYCASRVGSSRCSAVVYFKAALCSHNIVIRISELRACVCVCCIVFSGSPVCPLSEWGGGE